MNATVEIRPAGEDNDFFSYFHSSTDEDGKSLSKYFKIYEGDKWVGLHLRALIITLADNSI